MEAADSKSPNEQIQLGCIGVGGKGQSDVQNVSKFGKIYALCDVDATTLEGQVKAYKTEHNFTDFREMLDKMGDKIDAVTVSIPDHNHAVAGREGDEDGQARVLPEAAHAIRSGKRRRLGEIAKEKGVATQMGNQYTAIQPDAQSGLSN